MKTYILRESNTASLLACINELAKEGWVVHTFKFYDDDWCAALLEKEIDAKSL